MARTIVFLYGALAYALFLVTFLYAIGFVMAVPGLPKTIDDGAPGPIGLAILVNVSLLGVFAVQHTIMARPAFKRWWTTVIPAAAERSTFVLVTCAILGLLFWQWRPIPTTVWHVDAPWARGLLLGVSGLGFLLVLYSSFLIDHFDLFGLRQVWTNLRGRALGHGPFAERSVYRLVRHPLMLGFLIGFWFTPDMTGSHFMFAFVTTAYILVGTRIEERDLVTYLGDDYRRYQTRTPMLLPSLRRRPATDALAASAPRA